MTIVLPDKFNPELVKISPHVGFKWVQNGRGFVIVLTHISKEAVDAYVDLNLSLLRRWEKDQPLYSLQDISHPLIKMTPYFRKRLEEITAVIKETGLHGHSMILYQGGAKGRLMQLFGQVFMRKSTHIQQHWFIDREKAMAKLLEVMAKQREAVRV